MKTDQIRLNALNTMKTNHKQAFFFFFLFGVLDSCHGFDFLAPKPSSFVQRTKLGSNLVIDCSTDERSASTSLYFSYSPPHKWRLLESSEYTKQGNVYTIKFFMKHAGHFRCEARTSKGPSIYWPTKDGLLVVPDSRPQLTVSPYYEQVILSGQDVNFTCTTTLISANLQWLQINNNGRESPFIGTVSRVVGDSKQLILTIKNARENQSGFYKCVMNYYDGQRYKMASLKVYGSRAPTIIHHTGLSGDVIVSGKTKVVIECAADGYPKPLVKWFKDNKEITVPGCITAVDLPNCNGQEYMLNSWSLTSTAVRSQLVIKKFEENKATLFSCRAMNKFGHTIAKIFVVPDMFRFLQPQPRTFPIKAVEFGSTLAFDCTTNDRSAQSFLIHNRGGRWKNVTNTKPGNSAKKVFTVTKHFAMSDSGHYKCVAVNSTGHTIEWPNSKGMVIVPLVIRLPKLTVTPKPQQILSVGDSINFTCSSAEGNLKWYREEKRNKFKVVPNSAIFKPQPSKDSGSTSVLMVKNAQPSDSGLYKCVLRYRGKESFELVSVKVFDNVPPTITSYSGQSNRPIPIKSGVLLHCEVEYNSKSSSNFTIKWYKEAKEITIPGCSVARDLYVCGDKKYRIKLMSLTSSSVRALLKIKHFDKSVDAGVYTCTASNAYGAAMADMKVGI